MKRVSFAIASLLCLFFMAPQLKAQKEDAPRRVIHVQGEAEKEIIPNKIYLTISLREYEESKGNKISIAELENQLQVAVRKAGLKPDQLSVENVYGYNWYWMWKKDKNKDFMARKQYRLTLSDLKSVNKILENLDEKGVENMNISGYTHTDIDEMNQALEIEALKNAKAKAAAMVEALGGKLGQVVEINEMSNNYQPIYYARSNNMLMKTDAMAESPAQDIDFKSIKLNARVSVTFAIE